MSTSDDERVKVGKVDDKREGRAVIVVATESSVCVLRDRSQDMSAKNFHVEIV